MAKQLNFEQIIEQMAGLEEKIRAEIVRDILADLRDFAKTCTEDESAGFEAAIEVVSSNYISA